MTESDADSHLLAVVDGVIRPHLANIADETAKRPSVELEVSADGGSIGARTLEFDSDSRRESLPFRARVSMRRTGDSSRMRFHVHLMLKHPIVGSSYSGMEASGTSTKGTTAPTLRLTRFSVLNNVWSWRRPW